MRSRSTRVTITCLVAAAAATGIAPTALPASADDLAPVTTAPTAGPDPEAALAALEEEADQAGVAAQQADEAVLQHPSERTRAAAVRARASLEALAARQTPHLAALATSVPDLLRTPEPRVEAAANVSRAMAGRAVAYARRHLGDRYGYAKAGPNAFDCSGLTMKAYAAGHVAVGGHGATAQWRRMRDHHRLTSYAHRRPGDLIFYGRPGAVFHVAIYTGHGRMVEAPYPGKRVREVPVRSASRLGQVGRPTGRPFS